MLSHLIHCDEFNSMVNVKAESVQFDCVNFAMSIRMDEINDKAQRVWKAYKEHPNKRFVTLNT